MDSKDSGHVSLERELQGLIPLCNFTMTSKRFVVTDDFIIRSLEEDEIDLIAERVDPFVASKCSFGISTEWKQEFESLNKLNINLEKAFLSANIVTALRLFDAGDVSFPNIFYKIKGEGPNPLGFHGWGSVGGEIASHFGVPFLLTDPRPGKFKDFWEAVNTLFSTDCKERQETGLNLALRRFNYSYWQKPLEDKIVDMWIGFEALLGDQSRNGTARLIDRLQILLGRDDDERYQLRSFLGKAYDARSDVVHGRVIRDTDIIKATTMTFKTVVFELRRLLAKAIKVRTFISSDNWGNRKDFIGFLDTSKTSPNEADILSNLLKAIEPIVFTDGHSFVVHRKNKG